MAKGPRTGFEIAGIADMQRRLQATPQEMLRAAGAALHTEAELIMGDSVKQAPADRGTLRGAAYVRPAVVEGRNVEVTMGYGGAASGYAVYVHEGTGPAVGRPRYWPPLRPLMEWAGRVLGDESAGRAVQRAIWARGTKPRKFLERPLLARRRTLGRRVARHMARAIQRMRSGGRGA